MKKTSCYIIFLALLLSSCDKLLEVKPQSQITDQVFFRNEGDFEPNVVGIYTVMRSIANNVTYGTERSEELISATNSRFTVAWSQTLSPSSGAVNYSEWYRGIGHCNLLLEKIQGFAFAANPNLKKKIVGETLALRAYFYFHLLRVFGSVPIVLEAITDENVILHKRASASEVMAQVLSDLDAATAQFTAMTDFSKTNYPSKYRFAYGSVMAMKADALLWKASVAGGGPADLQAAVAAITEAESTGVSLQPDFAKVTGVRAAANNEVLMAAYYNKDETPGGNYAKNALPFKDVLEGAINKEQIPYVKNSTNGQGAYQISPLSKSLFTNPADKRIPYTWIADMYASGPKISWITKYPGTVYADDRYADNDLIIYRLADLYLLKAEAYAALEDVNNSKKYLDNVKLRAGVDVYAGDMTKTALEKEILNERGRELFFENKRWFDLVRFHKAGIIDVYNYVPNLKGKTTPLFWPVNTTVLANNPEMTQTDGYK
ncbi:RagB/SusD family nutrient uptake outer membrane protein [Chitinophaga sp. Ak27]|uniref:RagB/SusD family nutrient uptake outer membrane protein n=1 Tax=Chitinophaga sp. Ak27 TaxID=2726116 RepID=UPI00145D34D2|nr:RagB/SusD family nutrient uptake outer membrane protein [Chitinophaga sp. Ak27]NLU92408.1 RagB/SusD family nutrient uptake outer membrane protein [Chitinophaga sp. Ak27]